MWKMPEGAAQAVDDDGDIRAVLHAGDRDRALTMMMNRYGDDVLRYAYVLTHSEHLADEARQQVFVDAYRDLMTFAGPSLRSWVFGIAKHRCLDAIKRNKRWTNRFKNDPPPAEEPDGQQPERELDRSRLAKVLERCLAKLAPAARNAVVLRYVQGLSYDEASAIAGDQAGTLQQRVARALPVLRKCVDARLNVGGSR